MDRDTRRLILFKRKFLASQSTDADSGKQSTNMVRRTFARARTYGRRGKGRSRTVRRTKRASIPKQVRRLVNQQAPAKHILFSDNGVTGGNTTIFPSTSLTNSGPLLQFLNPLTRGTTVQQRIGDIVKISKIYLKVRTTYGTSVTGDVIIRWMLFSEKCNLGHVRTASEFGNIYFGSATPFTNSIRNDNNRDAAAAFTIHKRGSYTMRSSVTGAVEIRDWYINFIPKTPVRAAYVRGNVGTPADLDSGAMYLYMYTDNIVTGANGIHSHVEGNVYYHDA